MEWTAMSAREFERGTVLRRVVAGEMSIREATPLLAVSYRHARRLVARFRLHGAKGLGHRARGRASNRTAPEAYRAEVLALVRAHYAGSAERGAGQRFGPTLVAEHLWTDHGLLVPITTLTRWMLRDADLWSRARRERKAHVGELVQLDGSGHDWFEGRGPKACAMTMVDDATSRTVTRFSDEETTWAAAEVLQAWIAAHGVPRALYTDWKNVYLRPATLNEDLRGERPFTHFGHMCEKLGIQIIGAASPQAKGRVERGHGTHQDRLIKKLRLAGIHTIDAANTFLEATYLAAHNARFAIAPASAPASAVDYHRPRDRRRWPDAAVFCLETRRQVGADHVVQYGGRGLQLQPSARIPIKSTVLVREQREQRDGTLAIVQVGRDGHQRTLPWTPAAPRAPKPAPIPRVRPAPERPRALRPKLPMSHPWHRASERAIQRAIRRPGFALVQPPLEILTPSHP
ncbi:MAG: ISNCY family transposase [Gemmatimonadetes bacterium]|nr:ISNCY family transposase [Gemmatimonadota bacterium]